MTTSPPSAGLAAASPGPLFGGSRNLLMAILAVIYAGAIQFFLTFSPALLYGTYVLITAGVAGCLFFRWQLLRQASSVAPYLIWTFLYFLWGTAASGDEAVQSEAFKVYLKNLLVIGTVAVALERASLRTFARIVMIGAIGNFALCVYETIEPSVVADIAHAREVEATAYNVLRPAGLWSNPDEAATAYLFALLMARWAGGTLGLLGRICAIAGIYLGASRTGAYLLALCGAVHLWVWLRENGLSPGAVAKAITVLALATATTLALFGMGVIDLSDSWQLTRILDVTEETRDPDHVSRLEIARTALQTAIRGSWHGHGLFAFQCEGTLPAALELPSHNIFLAVWGEAGPALGLTYVLLMAFGLSRVFRMPLTRRDRRTLALMWLCYLIVSVTWHNNFTSFSGMLYIGLLWHLPMALQLSRRDPNAVDEQVVADAPAPAQAASIHGPLPFARFNGSAH